MWRAYSKVIDATDYDSAIDYLADEFSKSEFEWEHEAIYQRYIFEPEVCVKRGKTYSEALRVTHDLQEKKICLNCWAMKLSKYSLPELHHVKQYLPSDIRDILRLDKKDDITTLSEEEDEKVSFSPTPPAPGPSDEPIDLSPVRMKRKNIYKDGDVLTAKKVATDGPFYLDRLNSREKNNEETIPTIVLDDLNILNSPPRVTKTTDFSIDSLLEPKNDNVFTVCNYLNF